MSARLMAFVVWALVAAALAYWGLKLGVSPLAVPAATPTVADAPRQGGDLSRLLGAAPAPPAAVPVAESSRFRLVGVIADARTAGDAPAAHRGVALLAVDGKPPRPYRVGAEVDRGVALLTVSRRAAQLGPRGGPASVSLELPPLQSPATATLPRIGADGLPVGGLPVPGMAAAATPSVPGGVPAFPGVPPGMAPPGMALPGMAPPGMAPPGSQPSEPQESAGAGMPGAGPQKPPLPR